ncbi:MAG TPA: adenylate/guanylate cyclase domain-containing protein, partial [Candidatus Paceibacterota bacterium]|nr:adenylate/guanylate cyclase domain-containing protein [Candidatus Paceibacterota bacterium]
YAFSLILTGLFSASVAFLAMYIKRPIFLVLILLGMASVYTIVVFIAFDHQYALDLFYPNLGLIFTGAAVLTTQYSVTAREKKHIHETFSRYLAPQVIKELINNPDALRLGGKKENLTILFSDIRNFTALAESMGPEQLTSFLNQYLSFMTRIVLEHEGVIDKYIGDAIMAFWGTPLPNSNHERDGLVSALEMIEALEAFNKQNARLGNPVINVGIGLNSGEVTVGNMGSEKRFDYTVIGDSVNLASRLEGLTKVYGVNIIIGESTYKTIENDPTFLCRELDHVQVKGKKHKGRIYEAIPPRRHNVIRKILNAFNRGREAYYEGRWETAQKEFASVLSSLPTDGPSLLLQQRCTEFQKKPPNNWDGIFELTHK